MARSRGAVAVAVLVIVPAVLAAVVAAEGSTPSILTPIAKTPLGSLGPVADSALEDQAAAPVGAPIGTTMTEPKADLTANAPPGATDAASSSAGATGGHITEAAVALAAVFAF